MEISKQKRLEGKTAIVTGACSGSDGYGIGQAIAILFANHGANVLVVDIDSNRGNRTVETIQKNGGSAVLHTADVTIANHCKITIESAISIFGTLGIMIMISANHLLLLYLGIELLSLSLYSLIAFNKKSIYSSEAAVKYYIL